MYWVVFNEKDITLVLVEGIELFYDEDITVLYDEYIALFYDKEIALFFVRTLHRLVGTPHCAIMMISLCSMM